EEVLTEENNVEKTDQMMMMSRSMNYFKEKDKFNVKDFEKEVMVQPELVEAFRDYRGTYAQDNAVNAIDDFEISDTAVKKNQKYLRSILKLDKNFHVYVHARHDYIEKGYDEDKGMKFYKLYFSNEE
ncbi:MAG: nucleoid-associated protein, partial [Bacteroidia bacterium]